MSPRPTGYLRASGGRRELVLERAFSAPIDDVWAAITESDRLARWIGVWSGDPSTGTVQFRMTAEGDDVPESTYVIVRCEPPAALDLHSANDYGVWDLGLRLEHNDATGMTTLRFTQVVHDPGALESVGPGWEYYLDRLVAAETGTDVASISFDESYYPAMQTHYAALAASPAEGS